MLKRILPLSFLFLFIGASTAPFLPEFILGAGPQVGGWGLGGNPRPGAPLAFFEFAPSNGAGLGTACSCANVTGAKGETVTWTRASSAMCTKSASETSIANGDLVLCASNQPRVMSLGGPLGVDVESSRVNGNLQSEVSSNAVYTNTVSVTDDTTTSPRNDLTADTLTDSSGVATQSSCQTISTTSATQQTFSVYLAAGSLADATVTMTGTGSSTGDCSRAFSGLPSGSWLRGSCTSPAAYAGTLTAVTVCVTVGAAAVNTGSVIVWGRQWEIGAYATSYIPTTTVAVTRSADRGTLDIGASAPATSLMSMAVTINPARTSGVGSANVATPFTSNPISIADVTGAGFSFYTTTAGGTYYAQVVNDAATVNSSTGGQTNPGGVVRLWGSSALGTLVDGAINGTSFPSGSFNVSTVASPCRYLNIGTDPTGNRQPDAVLAGFCIDPSRTRCR